MLLDVFAKIVSLLTFWSAPAFYQQSFLSFGRAGMVPAATVCGSSSKAYLIGRLNMYRYLMATLLAGHPFRHSVHFTRSDSSSRLTAPGPAYYFRILYCTVSIHYELCSKTVPLIFFFDGFFGITDILAGGNGQ